MMDCAVELLTANIRAWSREADTASESNPELMSLPPAELILLLRTAPDKDYRRTIALVYFHRWGFVPPPELEGDYRYTHTWWRVRDELAGMRVDRMKG